jgi:hypothetical protein
LYKFAKQISNLKSKSINEFLQRQLDSHNSHLPNYLEQGRYSIYIKRYYDVLNSNDIKIVFYEDLKSRPLEFMYEICKFIDIDNEFYTNYKFYVSNKSLTMRSNKVHFYYVNTRDKMSLMMPRGYFYLRNIWQYFKPLYLKLNTKTDHDNVVSEPIRELVNQYYSGEKEILKDMLGREIPWCIHLQNIRTQITAVPLKTT